MPSLSAEATRYAAFNFALVDGKLAKSIFALSQEDYNALLVTAGQLESDYGNHMLTTALNAIRGSQRMPDEISKE